MAPRRAPAASRRAPDATPHVATAFQSPKLTERRFMQQVLRYAELMGWRWWHDRATNAPRACKHCKRKLSLPRNESGHPDLLLIRRPRVVWAELKAQRTPVTDAQRDWITELRACDQEAYVWRPDDWPEIERVLR